MQPKSQRDFLRQVNRLADSQACKSPYLLRFVTIKKEMQLFQVTNCKMYTWLHRAYSRNSHDAKFSNFASILPVYLEHSQCALLCLCFYPTVQHQPQTHQPYASLHQWHIFFCYTSKSSYLMICSYYYYYYLQCG